MPGEQGADGPGGLGSARSKALEQYLLANQGNAKYLVAVPSSMSAETFILDTGEPVMAMGGFAGGDPILTTDELARLVKDGTVRFFLLNGRGGAFAPPGQDATTTDASGAARGGPPGFGGQQGAAQSWVTANCTAVPSSAWQTSTSAGSTTGSTGFGGGQQLYDCASVAGQS
jgi:4-amino-4-deoxy-L-arabinose transferase-like glycosyltransferase